jgi:dTMP kinase
LAKGFFITFEGGEGAGKSTQVERLARRLKEQGAAVVTTREPGGSERAERIRGAVLAGGAERLGPLAEALLFSAARLDHLEAKIRPALRSGAFVLCDRFADSMTAYQGLDGGLEEGIIKALARVVVDRTRPDLTILLDLPAEVGLSRAAARRGSPEGADRFEAEPVEVHERLRQIFLRIARDEPDRCLVIDATRSADDIEAAIWRSVRTRFDLDFRSSGKEVAHGG